MKFFKKIITLLLVITLFIGGLYTYIRYIEPNMLIIKKESFSYNNINKSFKIVLFSDTHIGVNYKEEKLLDIANKINKEKPDIVIFVGDFLDSYYRDIDILDLEYLSSTLFKINSTYGNFAVWGNHDYGGGSHRIYKELMENGGFTLLENQNVYLDDLGVNIVGLDDMIFGVQENITLSSDLFNVILSHEPDAIDNISPPKNSLSLGGHSHGGQIYIPFLTEKILPIGADKYVKGLYTNTIMGDIYVTGGIGTTQLPYRFMNIPEIVVIDIKK